MEPTQRKMRASLARWYGKATPEQLEVGAAWYGGARAIVADMAFRHGVPTEVAAAVVAVLSPRIPWGRNVRLADELLGGAEVRGVLPASRDKASTILATHDTGRVSGPKVSAFYANLTGDESRVTVDTWVLRAVGFHTEQPSERQYRDIERAVVANAKRAGVTPAQYQAQVWVVIRDEQGSALHGGSLADNQRPGEKRAAAG